MTAATMNQSPGFVEVSKAWDITASMMEQILSSDETERTVASAKRGISLLESIGEGKDALYQQACEITSSISTKIENENRALQNESNELSCQIQRVQKLEEEVENMTKFTAEIIAKRRAAEQNIPVLKAEAAEVIDELDEIQVRHVKEAPKIKMRYSLFATMTNVKWDYRRTDVLAGEVSIPSKAVHRQFEIEKDIPEFDIAQKFWRIIEG